jgi:hypothetical protein
MGILLTTFNAALGLFNGGSYNDLGAYFAEEVVMYKVNDPHSPPYRGKTNVIDYLNKKQKSKLPRLNAPNPQETPVDGATTGTVSGSDGTYYDDTVDNPSSYIKVQYTFNFTLDASSHTWLITLTRATPS